MRDRMGCPMSASGNAAEELAEEVDVQEPSMEEILASIKQIIADDEATEDDGLSERERYTHPTEHSNTNEEVEASRGRSGEVASLDELTENPVEDAETALETEPALEAETVDIEPAPQQPTPAPRPTTLEQRLEEYRQRDRMRMQQMAEQSGFAPAQTAVPPIAQSAAVGGMAAPTMQVASEYVAKELDVSATVDRLAREVFAKHEPAIEVENGHPVNDKAESD